MLDEVEKNLKLTEWYMKLYSTGLYIIVVQSSLDMHIWRL